MVFFVIVDCGYEFVNCGWLVIGGFVFVDEFEWFVVFDFVGMCGWVVWYECVVGFGFGEVGVDLDGY